MARQVGQQLGERREANVVIDNKPGSGGMIGGAEATKAAPDDQTLLATTMTHAVNATLYKGKAPYDCQKDLEPVALLAGSPMLVVIPAASPIRDFKDLMAQAKLRALNGGSSGNDTPPHLTPALFNDLNGSQIQYIPYKGGAPGMTDLTDGQPDVNFSNFPENIAHVKSGKLRALAITGTGRHPLVPDVPTTAEAGLAQLAVENWTAVMAAAGAPDAIVERIAADVLKIMALPDIEERARTRGFRIDARGPRDFATFVANEVERRGCVIASAKIQAE